MPKLIIVHDPELFQSMFQKNPPDIVLFSVIQVLLLLLRALILSEPYWSLSIGMLFAQK